MGSLPPVDSLPTGARTRRHRSVGHPAVNRFRSPGSIRAGVAQISLLETALWPLDADSVEGVDYQTRYFFTPATTQNPGSAKREVAKVQVRAPLRLHAGDEYYLWGLLSLTMEREDSDAKLIATPYWFLKRLGLPTGGRQYQLFRDALDRLASASYHCDHFYNPLTQAHEFVTFGFFNIFLPPDIHSPQAWRIHWDADFFAMCKATGGRLLFDLDVYRSLDTASRRLFLKLKDRFWRSDQVRFDVDDLTVHGLGFSANRPLKKRKYDLMTCARRLLEHGMIALPHGAGDIHDLFAKRMKGRYVVTFHKGPYFVAPETTAHLQGELSDSPLSEPLKAIGFSDAAIRRILKTYPRNRIERWITVTQAAMEGKPKGFPGFRESPQAFCLAGIKNNWMPPEWYYAHEKQEDQRRWDKARHAAQAGEQELRDAYQAERAVALQRYLRSEVPRDEYDFAYQTYLTLYRAQNDPRAEQLAREATDRRFEANGFTFPEFSAWALRRQLSAGA